MGVLEGNFDSWVVETVMGKDNLVDLVATNLVLTKTVTNLTDTNSPLSRKIESCTHTSGGGGRTHNHGKLKWYKHCKHNT